MQTLEEIRASEAGLSTEAVPGAMSPLDRARLRRCASDARREARNDDELITKAKLWTLFYVRGHGFDESIVRGIAREFFDPAH